MENVYPRHYRRLRFDRVIGQEPLDSRSALHRKRFSVIIPYDIDVLSEWFMNVELTKKLLNDMKSAIY